MIVSQIVYDSPFQISTESDVQVVPGGEVLSLSVAIEKESGQVVQQRNVTVCFYMPEDGPCVVGAHSLDLKPGDTYGISPVSETRVSENCHTARVLADSQYGVALLGPKCPDPNREELLLARADEVKVGEEAVIRTFAKGDIPVNVLGFAMVGDDHFLVVRCIDGKAKVGPGMSGSPIKMCIRDRIESLCSCCMKLSLCIYPRRGAKIQYRISCTLWGPSRQCICSPHDMESQEPGIFVPLEKGCIRAFLQSGRVLKR